MSVSPVSSSNGERITQDCNLRDRDYEAIKGALGGAIRAFYTMVVQLSADEDINNLSFGFISLRIKRDFR